MVWKLFQDTCNFSLSLLKKTSKAQAYTPENKNHLVPTVYAWEHF